MAEHYTSCDPDALPDWADPAPFTAEAQGHSFTFFPAGKDRRDALIELIDEAERTLKVAYYVFAPDSIGEQVRDALVRAAKRGVDVTLIVDGFGATVDDEFMADLKAAGGTFCIFLAKWSRRALIRNHQKIVIADDRVAMMGGFNVEDDYFAPPSDNGWNDLGFRWEGETVGKLAEWFAELREWAGDADAQFRDITRRVRDWDSGDGPVRLLIGGPTKGLSSWAKAIVEDMKEGEKLDMMMAYFSPNKKLRQRIARIAEKGETHLIMAGKSDNGATIGASRSLYRFLLDAGAKIYEFMPCKMHTKLLVLDDTVYMGSANFDMRSLYLNLEIVLQVEDAALAERMRGFIQDHREVCCPITRQEHAKQATLWNRAKWRACWFLVNVVDYTVSRRLNLGF
ncbi:phospholipase D-like domain-containing protein [Aurantiacibacter aquimixticola]|uniref:Phospholipase D n=1 Tax=Aurantiacibacter aquimixticola TaxID=1958945 RepID=A0A419RU35_9SPHN|nr:phosphatidylserine/phosphatidylglycerophosphate/cardiolipin synthase family protein [Aurantiacibacter aquimixticola]RJY09296.1 phosphatidylserine/phosphatidylglycerophosphate/cardiolipin synthase family protein [Aurantiacibacter aquimixticola]